MDANLRNIRVQKLSHLARGNTDVDILRLDLLHPIVSGNKWFKLRYYLEEAIALDRHRIASFGGAFSNHIVATAFAAREAGLGSIGYIRGEEPRNLSPTLQDAASFGMNLVFLSRQDYMGKKIRTMNDPGTYFINEGGYGNLGAKGAATMLNTTDTHSYTHILCACGTGTMLAGVAIAALPEQKVWGISVLKNHTRINDEVQALLAMREEQRSFTVWHGYDFGGYAKHPPALLAFMKELWEKEQLPTDIVYTSKLLFAARDLIEQGHFPEGSRILLVHSGGLQGNRSLPPNTLPF